MSTPPRDIAEWMRLMERRVMLANRSGQAVLARQLTAEIIKVRDDLAGAADTRTPAAPIEFVTSSSVRFSDTGRAYSEVSIDFSDVTVATDASAITVDKYELWGRDETTWNGTGTAPTYFLKGTSAISSFLNGPYVPGSKWRFKVRAIGQGMLVPGNFSAEQLITMVADTTPPSVPPNPDLHQQLGVVEVKWNGKAASGNAMQADFARVEVAMGASSQPTAILPDIFLGAGSIFVTGLPYGEPRYFRMRAVDWSGNASSWSGDSVITRQPLVSGDISGLDTTIQEQTDAAQAAEASALQAAQDAQTAAQNASASATTATNAQTAATSAQNAAQASAATATAAQSAADAAAADADSAAQAATAAQSAAEDATAALQAQLGEGGVIIRGDTEPTVEQRLPNNVWMKDDGSMWQWDEGVQDWTPVTNQALIDLGTQVTAAQTAAQTAATNAANSASAASASQTAATNAQNAANASAQTANQAQAEAEAAAASALAAQNSASQAAADADAAAQAAGSSSAAALQAEQAAEAANLAADAAVDTVQSYILGGDTMIVNGNFDAPITSPPLGWPTRTLTYNEASSTTARSGSQVLRATPTTATIAYAYTDYFAAYTGQILYIEYYVRLREALKSGNSTQQLGAYVSCRNVAGTATVYSAFQNNGAPAVTLASLSTTTWTKVAVTQTLSPADTKDVRVGPRIPAVTTAGQNFEIDDFRVVDITQAKAALDAAAAAQATANTANAAAGSAQSTATSALNAASHNAKNLFSVDPPSGTAPLGTIWWQIDGTGKAIGQWQQTAGDANTDGGTWAKRDVTSAMIANLDVAKLTGGFIDATHIETETLRIAAGGTLANKLSTLDTTATKVTSWDDGSGNVTAAKVAGTLATTNIPAIPATKITSGTFPAGVVFPAGGVSGTLATGNIPAIDASKVTTGTLPAAVAVPGASVTGTVASATSATSAGSATNATNVTGSIGAAVSVPGAQVSGTVPVAAVPAIPTSKVTNLDSSLTTVTNSANAAQATANIAAGAASYSANPSFDAWASTWPDNYAAFTGSPVPTKDTTNFKIGTQAAKFVTDATTSAGMDLGTLLNTSAFPDLAYYTVEIGFMLTAGTLAGAEVLLTWNGYTGNPQAGVRLDQAIPSPVLGKWYMVTTTIARPTTTGGAFTSMGGLLMASHNLLGATRSAKTITFDWFNVRPPTNEELLAVQAKAKTDSWASPSDVTYIDGGKIYTDSIKSLQIDTNDLLADSAFIGSLRTTVLTADSVDATVLKSDAITAKHTITGALIQTTATASRGIKITTTALNAYDSTGLNTFSLSATTGRMSAIGKMATGATGEVGAAMIPAAESYNGKLCAVYITRDGTFPGGNTGGMWVEDASVSTPMNLNLRGHYGGHVEVITGHMYVRGSGTAVGNFSNWALGDRTTNGDNYLPNLWINPASGTGWLKLTNPPTVSATANVVLATTPAGVFYKTTSSIRYKADVQDWTPDLRALGLNPRSWVDRNPVDKTDPMKRYYGVIAEEAVSVVPELVTLNEFDEPDAFQYDRLGVALIPILKDVIQRLEALEGQ